MDDLSADLSYNGSKRSKKRMVFVWQWRKGGRSKRVSREGGGGVSFSVSLKESGGREAGR